jgi:hypothetical protein
VKIWPWSRIAELIGWVKACDADRLRWRAQAEFLQEQAASASERHEQHLQAIYRWADRALLAESKVEARAAAQRRYYLRTKRAAK